MTRKRKSDVDRAGSLMEFVEDWFRQHPTEYQRMMVITRKCSSSPSSNSESKCNAAVAHDASLRMLDWFVTNYARRRKVCYMLRDEKTNEEKIFNVFVEYKTALDYYHKELFDPFRRSCHEDGDKETVDFMSRLRQMNFFKWAFTSKVIDYVVAHAAEIEQDMIKLRTRAKKKTSVRKRQSSCSSSFPSVVDHDAIPKSDANDLTKTPAASFDNCAGNVGGQEQQAGENDFCKPLIYAEETKIEPLYRSSSRSSSDSSINCFSINLGSSSPPASSSPSSSSPSSSSSSSPPCVPSPLRCASQSSDELSPPLIKMSLKRSFSEAFGNTRGEFGVTESVSKMAASSQRFRKTHFAPVISDCNATLQFSLTSRSPKKV